MRSPATTRLALALCLSSGLVASCANLPSWPTSAGYSSSTKQPPAGTTPVGTAGAPTSAASLERTTLQGIASLKGQPIANGSVQVADALANTPAGAPGSSGLALAPGASLTTDAQGNFSVPVTGLVPGTIARMTVTSADGQLSVSALVSGEGLVTTKGYRVADATFGFQVNEVSLALEQIARGVLALAGILTPTAAAPILRGMMADLANTIGPLVATSLKNDPVTAGNLAYGARGSNTAAIGALVNTLVFTAQADAAVASTDRSAIQSVINAAKSPANMQPNAALAPVSFIGTNISSAIGATGLLTVTDAAAGQIYSLDPKGLASGAASTVSSGSAPAINTHFNPTFSAYAQTTNSIALTVNQNAQDQDFGAVYIKMPAPSINQALTAYQVLTNTGSKVTRGTVTGNLALNKNDAARSTVTIPTQFGGNYSFAPTAAMWAGYLALTSPVINSAQMATYQIIPETVSNPANYYVVLQYNAGNAFSATVNGAKTTTLSVNGITASSGNVTVQYCIIARDGKTTFPASGLANYTIPATLTP